MTTFAVDDAAVLADAVRGSAVAAGRVRAVRPPRSGSGPVILAPPLPLLGGTVTLDASAEIWGTAELQIAPKWPDDGRYTTTGAAAVFPAVAGAGEPGTSTWPALVDEPLSPFTRELFVEAGLELGNGQVLYVGLGYFRVFEPVQDDAPDGPITVTAYDRSAFLRDSRLTAPMSFPTNTSVAAVFAALVGPTAYPYFPATVFDYDAAADRITARVCERERLEFLVELATSRGRVFYFDSTGTPRVRSIPDPAAGWVADVAAGPGGVLAGWGRRQTRDAVYSAVVAEGDQTGDAAPPRAVVVDSNPDSPTWWDGDFGRIPRFYSSPLIETAAQASSAAAALLLRWSGLPYTVDLALAPNPALRPYDVVRVFPEGYEDPFGYEVHQLERLVIPLSAGERMTAGTRQKLTFPRPPAEAPGAPVLASSVALVPAVLALAGRPLALSAVLPAPLLTRKILAAADYDNHSTGGANDPPSSVATSGTTEDDVVWLDGRLAAAAGQPGRRLFGPHHYSTTWPTTFAQIPSAVAAVADGFAGILLNVKFGGWGPAWDSAAAGGYDTHCRSFLLSIVDYLASVDRGDFVVAICAQHEGENDKDANYGGPTDDPAWEPRWGPVHSRFTARFANIAAELDLPNVFWVDIPMSITFPSNGQFGSLGFKNRNPEMWNSWQYMTPEAQARTILAPDGYTNMFADGTFQTMASQFDRVRAYVADAGWGVQRFGVGEHTHNRDAGPTSAQVANAIRTDLLPWLRTFPGSSLAFFAHFDLATGLASGDNGWYGGDPLTEDAFSEIVEEFNFGAAPGGGGGVLFRTSVGATANTSTPALALTGMQTGDVVYLIHDCTATVTVGDPVGASTGWTPLATLVSNNAGVKVWRKRLVSGDVGASVTPTMSAVSRWGMLAVAYSGAHATTPEDVALVTFTENTVVASHTTPAITPATAGATILEVAADRGTATASVGQWVTPAGLTPRGSVIPGGNPGASIAAADYPNAPAAVARGPYTWGTKDAAGADLPLGNYVGVAIAIRPA